MFYNAKMDSLLRLILRVLLVPLGGLVAITIALAVLVVAHWNAVMALAHASPSAQEEWLVAFMVAAPVLATLFSMMAAYALLPAAIGVLVSELFAIRSWLYHAANGGLATWMGWSLLQEFRDEYRAFGDPTILIAAGLAGGLAYWLIAGWSAGFWKPVRAVKPA
jgi:hypothetical protein